MSIFKCKMCGGALEINSNETVATCEYCGTQQTLPKLDDRRANMYDRANHFRRNNDYDKAMGIYEQILNEDTTDAEAYWSLVLCRYGIEYVEDPSSHKRIPTVNRAQFTSVLADENYKSALQYADTLQKSIYETEAKAIDEIQKGILEISQKEEPFDVFICYKETDANGRRTPDSVLANDLYHQLTQEGFKVFFARITLEDKLGSAYEPYIFAALNSAKVMVVLGTKPEFFNAVWVKNEWSRYLSLIKNGAKKMLIPAYKDMDPYDLPEEFSHLQAQDMSKLGFMQDLIRGIKKIAQADIPKTTVIKETVISGENANTAPLLKRAFMFLEDGDWQSADEYCEKVLDLDPECARAYLGKLMAELEVRKQELLGNQEEEFTDSINYQKACRFADNELKSALDDYAKNVLYLQAKRTMTVAKEESNFKTAASIFARIKGYKDADSKKAECLEKAEACRKDKIFASALHSMNKNTVDDYNSAISAFETIKGWKDSDEKIAQCKRRIEEIKAKQEAERLERERRKQEAIIEAEKRKRLIKKIFIILSSAAVSIIVVLLLTTKVIIPSIEYNKAEKMLVTGKYEDAMEAFREIDFKDSYSRYCEAFSKLKDSYRKKGGEYLAAGDKINAAVWYRKSGDNDLANSIYDIGSLVYIGKYTTAGIMADGTLKYQTNDKDINIDEELEHLKDVNAFVTDITVDSQSKDELLTDYSELFSKKDNIQDIIDLEFLSGYLVLYNDGTVEHIYSVDSSDEENNTAYNTISSDLKNWHGIISIQNCGAAFIGIRYDGSVKFINPYSYFSFDSDYDEKNRVYEVLGNYITSASWNDIIYVSSVFYTIDYDEVYWTYAIGIKSDGSVVSTGNGLYYEDVTGAYHRVTDRIGYYDVTPNVSHYGNYHDVSDWKLW